MFSIVHVAGISLIPSSHTTESFDRHCWDVLVNHAKNILEAQMKLPVCPSATKEKKFSITMIFTRVIDP